MLLRTTCAAALALLLPLSVSAAPSRCDQILKKIGNQLADVNCFESTDLTTTNPATTPLDNSIAGLPLFAFTPTTDRGVIAPVASSRPPITIAVPGIQIQARIASDPTGEARFLLRLPDSWNGRLVVAGASGTRSEFNGDFVWSDYVVQKGYAYASQNKGVLNLQLSSASDPLACRLNPSSGVFVRFYDNEANQPFTRWAQFIVLAAQIATDGVKAAYGPPPRYTYAVGTSNGGYQVRRALETGKNLFDGGVDWEGTFVDEHAPNLLTDLPAAILNFPDYVASGRSPTSTAAKNIMAAGYPPDIVTATSSLWTTNSNSFWEVTQCQWQKRLDPAYNTYGSGPGNYNYVQRLSYSDVGDEMAAFATSGDIQAPLITVAGTMDSLLPIDHHARAYARKVAAAQDDGKDNGNDDGNDGKGKKQPAYRLYEVQNGNHVDSNQALFPSLELITPHAQKAFDLMVNFVENKVALPPDQCIPRGGAIAAAPTQPGHCATQFVGP
jgi:hypothetical protein